MAENVKSKYKATHKKSSLFYRHISHRWIFNQVPSKGANSYYKEIKVRSYFSHLPQADVGLGHSKKMNFQKNLEGCT